MKLKKLSLAFFAAAFALAALFSNLAFSLPLDIAAERENLSFGGIVAFKNTEAGAKSVQELVSGALAEGAGETSELIITALAQSSLGAETDFSVYVGSLCEFLLKTEVSNASTRLKYALTLLMCGSESNYILYAAESSVGEYGIISYIYGLHLADNGVEIPNYSAASLAAALLEMQCPDGGWALSGTVSDTDVTAMTLCALAPHKSNAEIGAAIEKAVALLSVRQSERGDFSGFGVANAETTAQVIVALCALGINPGSDARFLKNGASVLDGLALYLLENGSYSHVEGGAYSHSATSQALCALVAAERLGEGKGSLFVSDRKTVVTPDESDAFYRFGEKRLEGGDSEEKGDYRLWVCLCAAGAGALACAVLFILKKKSPKNYIAVAALVAVVIALTLMLKISSPEEYYSGEPPKKENPCGSVMLTISCAEADGLADYIPPLGVILPQTSFEIEAGDTVFDILTEASKMYKILLDCDVQGYVRGIASVYETDFGELSGWLYFVNGASPAKSCRAYVLEDGDKIEWVYTLNGIIR